MRRNLEKKLLTRTSVLKEYDAIPLLKLLQLKLHRLHNPPPVTDDKKKKKPETSVQIAEKLFFSHQGPLLDIEGPGSVFYMIRAREKSRMKRQAHLNERQNARQRQQNGHMHSLRLPQTLVMAANMAGATETGDNSEQEQHSMNFVTVSRHKDTDADIDAVARQNSPFPVNVHENNEVRFTNGTQDSDSDSPRAHFTESLPDSLPTSFRRIQSAVKGTIHRSMDSDLNLNQSHGEMKDASYVLSRPVTRFEKYKTETNLRNLELKVAEWLRKDNPKSTPNVAKLRRLQIEVSEPTFTSIVRILICTESNTIFNTTIRSFVFFPIVLTYFDIV
jgi:hypothetical protein